MGIPYDKVKDVLITKTAIKTLKPEQIVDRVINFQFKDAREYTRVEDEIEISGFGKFIRSRAKTRRKLNSLKQALEKLEEQAKEARSTEQDYILADKIKSLRSSIAYLEQKQLIDENRLSGDSRGNQEQADSTRETEGDHRGSLSN